MSVAEPVETSPATRPAPPGAASRPAPSAARWLAVPLAAFALGWLGTAAVRAAPGLFELYLAANENKYLVMSGGVGPVTYLVEHDDLATLERLAREDDSVLGAEQYALPATVAVAFVDRDAPGIGTVATLPGTRSMVRRRVAMICH